MIPFCSSYIRSNDSLVLEKIQGILEQLPTHIELPATIWTAEHQHLSSATSTHQLQLSPYWILLSQEASQWNHTQSVVSGSLSYLLAVVKGNAAMLEDDENVYQALVTETVPKSWQVSTSGLMIATQLSTVVIWANPILFHHAAWCMLLQWCHHL